MWAKLSWPLKGILVLALVAGVGLVTWWVSAPTTPTPAPAASVAPPVASAPVKDEAAAVAAAGCKLVEGDMKPPEHFGNVDILFDDVVAPLYHTDADGPQKPSKAGAGHCYSHSAVGAALAAANMVLQWDTPARLWLAQNMMTGPHQAEAAQFIASLPADALRPKPNHQPVTIRGVKTVPDGEGFVVHVWFNSSGISKSFTESTTVWAMKMRWVDGDWKWEIPSNDNPSHEYHITVGQEGEFKPLGGTD